jgi:integrase/recombinase XerD
LCTFFLFFNSSVLREDYIFDTLIDTRKIYVSMKTKFVLRKDIIKDDKAPVYLHITGNKQRERIFIDLYVDVKQWDEKNNCLKKTPENYDHNLILENIIQKITKIKVGYRLSEKVLTPALLKRELRDNLPRINFLSFYKFCLEEEKPHAKPATQKKNTSVYHKLKEYQDEIIFTDINYEWFQKLRAYLKSIGNANTTINSNITIIKKYLRLAKKKGIKLVVELDDIEGGSTDGNRNYLNIQELQRFYKYYFNEFIPPTRRLVLGYFLFSCFTGLRISDVQKINRKDVLQSDFQFVAKKTTKDQSISLNQKAKDIILHDKLLFERKFEDQFINRELKQIALYLGVKKVITFHVARHTFATSFLRAGGKVENLQKLLGHSNISQTMTYVHLVALEANKDIHLMDDLF